MSTNPPKQKKDRLQLILNRIFAPTWPVRFVFMVIILTMMLLITLLVYMTGGIKYVYSHTMYLPVIFSALLLGWKGGLAAGIIAGALLGPAMPVDVETGAMQDTLNWVYRMGAFALIGSVIGVFREKLDEYLGDRLYLFTHLSGTDIPSLPRLIEDAGAVDEQQRRRFHFIQVRIENYTDLSDFLGESIYSKLLMRASDRLNGEFPDAFGIYAKDGHSLMLIKEARSIQSLLTEIKDVFSDPLDVEGIPVHLDISVGASPFAKSIRESVHRATLSARYAGVNNYGTVVYDESHFKTDRDVKLLGSVKKAIRQNEFSLVFQPVYDASNGNYTHAEVLLRWESPTFGPIPPGRFIPLIEKTSLINTLSEWVVREALRHLKSLKDENIDISIAVNLSAKTLFHRPFFEKTKQWLETFGIDNESLMFEITESALMNDPKRAKDALQMLNDHRIALAIDDFGTGYSSLSYLKEFPVQQLKIDQTFIRNIDKDEGNATITKTAVGLARDFGLTAVAEGVETKKQSDQLIAMGCVKMQGFHYARPMPFVDFKRWMLDHSQ